MPPMTSKMADLDHLSRQTTRPIRYHVRTQQSTHSGISSQDLIRSPQLQTPLETGSVKHLLPVTQSRCCCCCSLSAIPRYHGIFLRPFLRMVYRRKVRVLLAHGCVDFTLVPVACGSPVGLSVCVVTVNCCRSPPQLAHRATVVPGLTQNRRRRSQTLARHLARSPRALTLQPTDQLTPIHPHDSAGTPKRSSGD